MPANKKHDEPLSDAEVAEIEARYEAATPGPWTTQAGAFWICDVGRNDCGVWSTAYPPEGEPFPFAEQQSDAEFIAHAREDVPALCQTVRALRAETAICKGEITAADPGKWGHESKIHLLKSQLEQVTKERDNLYIELADAQKAAEKWYRERC